MSDEELSADEQAAEALELRVSGLDYAAIAGQVGLATAEQAHALVQAALDEALTETGHRARLIDVVRLDSMLLSLAPKVQRGNLGAIDRALRVMIRRAKLLSLDAGGSDQMDPPVEDEVERARRRRESRRANAADH